MHGLKCVRHFLHRLLVDLAIARRAFHDFLHLLLKFLHPLGALAFRLLLRVKAFTVFLLLHFLRAQVIETLVLVKIVQLLACEILQLTDRTVELGFQHLLVFLAGQDVQDDRLRIDPSAPRIEIRAKRADREALRADPERGGREHNRLHDAALFGRAFGEDKLAFHFGNLTRHRDDVLPLDARLLQAEIILAQDFEINRLLGQERFLPIDPLRVGHRRRVLHRVHAQAEIRSAGQAEFIHPGEWKLERHMTDHDLGGLHFLSGNLQRALHRFEGDFGGNLPGCLARPERSGTHLAAQIHFKNKLAALDKAQLAGGELQRAVRQVHVGGRCHESPRAHHVGTLQRLDFQRMPQVADAENHHPFVLLSGETEHIAVARELRADLGLQAVLAERVRRALFRGFRQFQHHIECLAVGNREIGGGGLKLGEGVSLDIGKRHQPAFERIEAGLGCREESSRNHQHESKRGQSPFAMPRHGQRVVELAFPRLRRDHLHRRRTQPGGKRIARLGLALQLDHPKQPIAETGVSFRDEPRELFLAAVPPHPTVQPVRRKATEQRNSAQQDHQPRPTGRLPDAVKTIDQ